MPWDPKLYTAFAAPRLRPAADLLARVDAEGPARIADLGCGTGAATRLLALRWPNAVVVGVDSSPEMLRAAAAGTPSAIRWVAGDAGTWTPEAPLDVLFSNAALHWLDHHETLFPRLMGLLAPHGVLAVQMPHNHYAASHKAMGETVEAGPWASTLRPLSRRFPVADPEIYYDILSPHARSLDIWESEYLHVLEGEDPVVKWTMGTALKPLLDALEEPLRGEFLAEYTRRIAEAYPPRADGRTLFPFHRLFIVAKR
ncbi:methyltransferase domain-containing protein [Magnetospirillum sp. UT-4]|uniref:methyltransferase domain-containing protein n=1 Tax=Magnetospirillum sp. UT-4 TaxID=2681467 RepID=UPI0013805CCB|nr:methyltransferase domain-containing protein [Magnetospirillum sp. UT-4]CAA7624352.1 Trans-aconitate 2-methyltransferase [Magnetospirillum sp. UT-4]